MYSIIGFNIASSHIAIFIATAAKTTHSSNPINIALDTKRKEMDKPTWDITTGRKNIEVSKWIRKPVGGAGGFKTGES